MTRLESNRSVPPDAVRNAELTRAARRVAVRRVCALARDAADAALVLDVLGLNPTEATTTTDDNDEGDHGEA